MADEYTERVITLMKNGLNADELSDVLTHSGDAYHALDHLMYTLDGRDVHPDPYFRITIERLLKQLSYLTDIGLRTVDMHNGYINLGDIEESLE
jgi:hypothetical protein